MTVHTAGGTRGIGQLFNITTGHYALRAGRFTRAIVDGDHNNSVRARDLRAGAAEAGAARSYGLFFGERDQNQQVNAVSPAIYRMCRGVLPAFRQRKRSRLHLRSTRHQGVAGGSVLNSFTAARHMSDDPVSRIKDILAIRCCTSSLRYSVQVTRVRGLLEDRTAERLAAIFRRCSSIRIRIPSGRR